MDIKPSSKIQELYYTLAEPPWAPDDSHCSPCTVYPFYKLNPMEPNLPFYVWGSYNGDTTRKSFYAQETCIDNSTIKRLVFIVTRMQETSPGSNEGLYIGFVDTDTLNDINKLFNPSQWAWAGYLPDLPGGTPLQYYYVVSDSIPVLDPDKTWWLLMVTNGSYEDVGWAMGGWGTTNLDPNTLRLWRYTLNEPGIPDGWNKEDNYFRGTVIPYTAGSGTIDEPVTILSDKNFPNSIGVGEQYNYEFIQLQPNAFPCGCPSILWYSILDVDTNQIIIGPKTMNVPCGYSGVQWADNIVFNNPGVYHLRLTVGHKWNNNFIIDETYNFNVTVTGPPSNCESYTSEEECISHSCYWYNNSCHSNPPPSPPPEIPPEIWQYILLGVMGLGIGVYIARSKEK